MWDPDLTRIKFLSLNTKVLTFHQTSTKLKEYNSKI